MKLPITALVASLVLGFAFGIYFYHILPGPSRTIASTKDKTDPKLIVAFQDCINENVKDGKMNFNRSDVDGHNWAILSAECLGDKAKALYEAVEPTADEQYIHYSDGRRGIGRFFGGLYPPSQCARVTRNSKGSDMNLYSCSIRLDLTHEIVDEMKQ